MHTSWMIFFPIQQGWLPCGFHVDVLAKYKRLLLLAAGGIVFYNYTLLSLVFTFASFLLQSPLRPGRVLGILRYEGAKDEFPDSKSRTCTERRPCDIVNCPFMYVFLRKQEETHNCAFNLLLILLCYLGGVLNIIILNLMIREQNLCILVKNHSSSVESSKTWSLRNF